VTEAAPHHRYASHPTVFRRHRGLRSWKLGTTREVVVKTADWFLMAAAFISFVFSVYLWFQGLREEGLFVGIWVPSILAFGGFVRSALNRS